MRRPVFSPVPVRDHLVVGEQRAVEQNDVGAGQALAQRRRDRGRARHEDEPAPSRCSLDADIGAGLAASAGVLAFEIERHLAGDREQFRLEAAGERKALARAHRAPADDICCQHAEDRIGGERRRCSSVARP